LIYEQLLAELASNNYKLTPQRREIIRILIRARSPLSAKEIYKRLSVKLSNLSFDTVYRTLATLKDLGIVNKLDFQDGCGRYELNRCNDHHHHMVCLKCGEAWEIPGCPVEHLPIGNLPNNFKVTDHRFELFGYCQSCQD